MAEWAADLSPRARERFRCRHRHGRYEVPSEFVIRDALVRVDPDQLDRALQRFHAAHGGADDAIDGKTLRNAIHTDAEEAKAGGAESATGAIGEHQYQVHILGAVGQRSGVTHTQKKSTASRSAPTTRPSAPTRSEPSSPMLDGLELDFAGKTFTADALLRELADFLRARGAHFVFTAKGNQPTLLDDIALFFRARGEPDFREPPRLAHGRIETRAIRTTTQLNDYPTFPHVGQAASSSNAASSSRNPTSAPSNAPSASPATPDSANPQQLLALNRGHWTVEAVHHILDNAFDEDRLRIRTGHVNTIRLRRFAIGLIRARGLCVAATLHRLNRHPRQVFDYLRISENSRRPHSQHTTGGGTN